MKLLAFATFLVSAVVSVLGQTIEIGAPVAGSVLYPGKNFTAQVIRPISMAGVVQVGIALALNKCPNGVCNSQPDCPLEYLLYVGPWTPNTGGRDGSYQNFSLQVPNDIPLGAAVFTLVHFGLLGAGYCPFEEYRNVSVTIA